MTAFRFSSISVLIQYPVHNLSFPDASASPPCTFWVLERSVPLHKPHAKNTEVNEASLETRESEAMGEDNLRVIRL